MFVLLILRHHTLANNTLRAVSYRVSPPLSFRGRQGATVYIDDLWVRHALVNVQKMVIEQSKGIIVWVQMRREMSQVGPRSEATRHNCH